MYTEYMQNYLIILGALLLIDLSWIGLVASSFYKKHLGYIMGSQFAATPALIFYALYAYGVLYFAVQPALAAGSWSVAAGRGALLGLIAYGTYDLTNHATIARWPAVVTVVDMGWGLVVTALVSTIAYLIASR